MILLASLGLFPQFCFLDLNLGCVLTSEFSYKVRHTETEFQSIHSGFLCEANFSPYVNLQVKQRQTCSCEMKLKASNWIGSP